MLMRLTIMLVAAALAMPARAEVEVRAGAGYSVLGRLQGATDVDVQAIPISLALHAETKAPGRNWGLGVVLQHQLISYSDDGVQHSGTNLLAGVALAVNLHKNEKRALRLEADYYPYNDLSVSSESRGTVNGEEFLHSSLSTYTGPGASAVRLIYVWELAKGQFNPRERLRYGIALTHLIQPLTTWEVVTATSNSDLAPEQQSKSDVDYTLSITSLDFQIGFVF